jgi:L-threonylcarbamoyladenylate synthase
MTRSLRPLTGKPASDSVDEAETFTRAVAALRRGELIVFPTETLYGLGADALNSAAVERVFQLKGRNRQTPIPVLVADEAMLVTLVTEIPPIARRLMGHFWPGPLTIVLPARAGIPEALLNRDGGIGVRVSSQPIATRLVGALGRPLTATSANPAGEKPARTAQEAKRYFRGQIELFVDGGTLTSSVGSTVVAVVGNALKIIRDGEISAARLKEILPKEELSR